MNPCLLRLQRLRSVLASVLMSVGGIEALHRPRQFLCGRDMLLCPRFSGSGMAYMRIALRA